MKHYQLPLKYNGQFFGEYELNYSDYHGVDYFKKCFIFPGQGVAYAGMLQDICEKVPCVRDCFLRAQAHLEKYSLPALRDYVLNRKSFSGKELDVVKNLSLMTLEVALAEALAQKSITPRALTAHSFGEYAALVVAGVVEFEDMLDIVYQREILSPVAHSLGKMLACACGVDKLKQVLDQEEYYLSNINSKKQVVITLSREADEKAILKKLKKSKVPARLMENVPHPYHSPMMKGVAEAMYDYLETKNFSFKAPQIPLYSSVGQKWLVADSWSRDEVMQILCHQLTEKVDFVAQIEEIYKEKGILSFVELGPGETHLGFLKNIIGEHYKAKPAESYFNSELSSEVNLEQLQQLQENPTFKLLSKMISGVTGYEINEISVHDKFQEDLGIDSIKKAEIIFKVLKEGKIIPGNDFNLSRFKDIGSSIKYLNELKKNSSQLDVNLRGKNQFKRYTRQLVETPISDPNKWMALPVAPLFLNLDALISSDLNSAVSTLKNHLSVHNKEKIPLYVIDTREMKRHIPEQVWDDPIHFRNNLLMPLIELFQTCSRDKEFKSFGLYFIKPNEHCLLSESLDAFLKSFRKETQGFSYKSLAIDPELPQSKLEEILSIEASQFLDFEVCYKEGKRYIYDLVKAPVNSNASPVQNVVVIGGAGGITQELVSQCVLKEGCHVLLMGRSKPRAKKVTQALKELSKCAGEVQYLSVDATDKEDLGLALTSFKEKFGKIDLVINGAGYEESKLLSQKAKSEILKELDTKFLINSHLMSLAAELELTRVHVFSSIVSYLGNPGQTIYSMVNALITEMGRSYNLQAGKTVFKMMAWPAWDELGMTENLGILHRLKEMGVGLLTKKEGKELYQQELTSTDENWDLFYYDKQDDFLYKFLLYDLLLFAPLIGRLENSKFPRFHKRYDLEYDSYLHDHKITDHHVVPAAAVVGSFLCLSYFYHGKWGSLTDFSIPGMLLVESNYKDVLIETNFNQGKNDLVLKTEIPHFLAKIDFRDFKQEMIVPKKEIVKEVFRDSIYSKEGLYFGKGFQFIEQAWSLEGDAVKVRLDDEFSHVAKTKDFFDHLIKWVDAGFQSLCVAGLIKNKGLGIPLNVERITPHPNTKISKNVFVYAQCMDISQEMVKGDCIIVNENDELLLEMVGVDLIVINSPERIERDIIEFI